MNQTMTILLTHTRMIIIRSMVKHAADYCWRALPLEREPN